MIAASSFLRTRATALTVKAEATTQVKRNKNVAKLQAGYLFPEIAKRRNAHQAANPDAKIIAGGHSLLPAMKLRLAMPGTLVDIGRVDGLSGIQVDGDAKIGAMTTYRQLMDSAARLILILLDS